MPGALGYTVWLVQPDGTLGARLFGRECWGPVVAAAIGLHKDGLEPKGERGRFGFPTPRTPPPNSSRSVSKPTTSCCPCWFTTSRSK